MCLAVPGRLTSVEGSEDLSRVGRVDFGGVAREVSLAFVPDAKPGDYVLVHVGLALTRVDAEEAERLLEALRALGADAEGNV